MTSYLRHRSASGELADVVKPISPDYAVALSQPTQSSVFFVILGEKLLVSFNFKQRKIEIYPRKHFQLHYMLELIPRSIFFRRVHKCQINSDVYN